LYRAFVRERERERERERARVRARAREREERERKRVRERGEIEKHAETNLPRMKQIWQKKRWRGI
jgi:hypothetical protein